MVPLYSLYLMRYIWVMKYTIETTKHYDKWFKKLKDSLSKIKVLARLSRVENGNFGEHKQVGTNFYELRFFSAQVSEFIIPSKETELFFSWSAVINPASRKILKMPKHFWNKWRTKPWL